MPRPGGARVLRGYGGMPRSTREMTVITVTFPSFGAPSSHANRDFFHEVVNPIPSERVHSPATVNEGVDQVIVCMLSA